MHNISFELELLRLKFKPCESIKKFNVVKTYNVQKKM